MNKAYYKQMDSVKVWIFNLKNSKNTRNIKNNGHHAHQRKYIWSIWSRFFNVYGYTKVKFINFL